MPNKSLLINLLLSYFYLFIWAFFSFSSDIFIVSEIILCRNSNFYKRFWFCLVWITIPYIFSYLLIFELKFEYFDNIHSQFWYLPPKNCFYWFLFLSVYYLSLSLLYFYVLRFYVYSYVVRFINTKLFISTYFKFELLFINVYICF